MSDSFRIDYCVLGFTDDRSVICARLSQYSESGKVY